MPRLRNLRHERFAQEIAKGKNGADAYLAAGYALARDAAYRNAYRLRSREDIKVRNRQRAKWRDRQQVDMTGSVEHRLAAMTPEERARDTIELVERVRARLAALRTIEHEPEE
jgi:phage terminase small subunit